MRYEAVYCDHCGEVCWTSDQGTFRDHDDFADLPFDIESANAGESGTVCRGCQNSLDRNAEEGDTTFRDLRGER